MLNTMIDPWEY